MITLPNSLKCAFLPVQQTNVKKKIFSPTFFNFRFQLQKRISFPNENDFHFAFHFQNQIHLEKVLAASENL
nr:MAG TPA: hypothetical protein [Caudoviricetes sp.]